MTLNARVLIAEDEPKIAQILRDYFEAEGAKCTWVADGSDVAEKVQQLQPQLLLLDLMLPGKGGLDICRSLAGKPDLAILIITARVDEIDRLLGLELGADDYICKPFSPREVVARAKAVLRRLQVSTQGEHIQLGALRIDPGAMQAFWQSELLELTPVEFALLLLFARHPNEVLPRSRLLAAARGTDYAGYERNIDTHMKNLRKKLRSKFDSDDPFRTVYGVGYALNRAVFMEA